LSVVYIVINYVIFNINQLNIKDVNISVMLNYSATVKYDGWTWRLGVFHEDWDDVLLGFDNFCERDL